jgi:hypothetical protein
VIWGDMNITPRDDAKNKSQNMDFLIISVMRRTNWFRIAASTTHTLWLLFVPLLLMCGIVGYFDIRNVPKTHSARPWVSELRHPPQDLLLSSSTILAIVTESEMRDRTRGLLLWISLDSTRASFTAATRPATTAKDPAALSA